MVTVKLHDAETSNAIRERVAETMLRAQYGLMRPLFQDMTDPQKRSWLTRADDFISVAHQCGLYFETGPRQ